MEFQLASRKVRSTKSESSNGEIGNSLALETIEKLVLSQFQGTMREVEKKVRLLDSSTINAHRTSTGSACLDLTLGGGLTPGFHQFSGQEASGKTTASLTAIGATLASSNVPVAFYDAEGSGGSDPSYLENVLRTVGVQEKAETLFGIRGTDGKYVVQPKVSYRDDPEGETFFSWLAGIARRMPDKRLVGSKWWRVYEDTKENKARIGDYVDQRMTRASNGGLYVPAADGSIQFFIVLDSLPALIPEGLDDDDPNNGLAIQARMYSKNFPRVKGRLRKKRICLLGVNQLRAIPMNMYGPKETEMCGIHGRGSTVELRECRSVLYLTKARIWRSPRSTTSVRTRTVTYM